VISEAEVRAALDEIHDPCSVVAGAPAGLDEFGLVTSVSIEPEPDGAAVRVTVGVTEPSCLMAVTFIRDARNKLAALPGVTHADVSLDPGLRWTENRLRPEYRVRLERKRARSRRS